MGKLRCHSEETKRKIKMALKGRITTPSNLFQKNNKFGERTRVYVNGGRTTNRIAVYRIFHREDVCSVCGKECRCVIHHIDFNQTNNNISNLIELCRRCHHIAHNGQIIPSLSKCLHCEKEFRRQRTMDRKFCSRSCMKANRSATGYYSRIGRIKKGCVL
jgi:hypothetical protein